MHVRISKSKNGEEVEEEEEEGDVCLFLSRHLVGRAVSWVSAVYKLAKVERLVVSRLACGWWWDSQRS